MPLSKPITGSDGCCERAASGHAAAPPRSVMNSRRFMSSMGTSPLCAVSPPTDPVRSVFPHLSLP
jgi:hypothetical protein